MPKAIRLLHRTALPTKAPASIAASDKGVWVSDVETRELSLISPHDGTVIEKMEATVRRPQTISWDGEELWEYDEETSNLYRKNLTDGKSRLFGKVSGVNFPYLGFTFFDRTLWLISPDQPYFTVSNNLITVVKFPRRIRADEFAAPSHSCRGLCHDGEYLWTLDVEEAELFAMHPETGHIVTSYRLPGTIAPSSLIVTEDRVWTIDLKSNELLTYELDRAVQHTASGGRRSKVDIVYTIRNMGPGIVEDMEMSQCLSQEYIHQRLLAAPKVVPAPNEEVAGQWGDDPEGGIVVVNKIGPLEPAATQDVTVSLEVETVDLQWHIFPHLVGDLEEIPFNIRRNYLFDEMVKNDDAELVDIVKTAQALFQTDDKEIQAKVEEIVGDETNPYWIARKIYDFVVDKVDYILPYSSIATRKILKQGKGSCGNHATIFIALCEAAGLPARSIIGFGIWKDDARLGYLDHEIPEVYLPNYGWVPADTSRFMSLPIRGSHPLTKYRSFGSLSDRFFVNGFGRDLTSPWARRRYQQERLPVVEGEGRPEELFFLRWESSPVPTWKE